MKIDYKKKIIILENNYDNYQSALEVLEKKGHNFLNFKFLVKEIVNGSEIIRDVTAFDKMKGYSVPFANKSFDDLSSFDKNYIFGLCRAIDIVQARQSRDITSVKLLSKIEAEFWKEIDEYILNCDHNEYN